MTQMKSSHHYDLVHFNFKVTNPTPPKPNTQPTSTEAPKAEPSPLAESVTVKAGIVAVRKWMANEGKGKS